jgi:plastocyanin
VPAGAAVRVVNRDREAHTVTLGGGDGTSVTVAGGASGTLTAPAAAGSYPVGCAFHGDMTSTLVVV